MEDYASKVKRDPSLFEREVKQINEEFNNLSLVIEEQPSSLDKRFIEVVGFLAQVSAYYLGTLDRLPSRLVQLIETYAPVMHPEVRKSLFSAIVLLRNREQIGSRSVLKLCLKLFRMPDKVLRAQAFSYFIKDVKRVNKFAQHTKLNKEAIEWCREMFLDSNITAAKRSLHLMMSLYKLRIWNDARAINVLGEACLSKQARLAMTAANFFLAADAQDLESDSEDEEEEPDSEIIGARKSRGKKAEKVRQKKNYDKRLRRKLRKKQSMNPTFLCIDKVTDPNRFVEELVHSCQKQFSKGNYELKLVLLRLAARVAARHKLLVFELYSYLQRFLEVRGKNVSLALVIAAEGCHEMLPPDELQPLLKKVIDNFVTEQNSEDQIVMGLNAVREICARQPLVMTEDLLHDLAGFKNFRNKGVVMAARSLINLYRQLKPSLLSTKDRLKYLESGIEVKDYLVSGCLTRVPGVEFLEKPLGPERTRPDLNLKHLMQAFQQSENLDELDQKDSRLVAVEAEGTNEDEEAEEGEAEEEEADELIRPRTTRREGVDEKLIELGEESGDEAELHSEDSSEYDDSCSDSEDEAEDDSEDEAEGDSEADAEDDLEAEADPETADAPEVPSVPLEYERILTQKDWDKINQMKKEQLSRKRKIDWDAFALSSSDEEDNPHGFVQDSDISVFQHKTAM
jgi:protein SDA1